MRIQETNEWWQEMSEINWKLDGILSIFGFIQTSTKVNHAEEELVEESGNMNRFFNLIDLRT